MKTIKLKIETGDITYGEFYEMVKGIYSMGAIAPERELDIEIEGNVSVKAKITNGGWAIN